MRLSAVFAAVALLAFAGCRRHERAAGRIAARPPEASSGWIDSRGDGFPDAAHLTSASDRQALRRWIAFIAESEFQHPRQLAARVDCAGFARWVLQEALRRHDARWWRRMRFAFLPPAADVAAWNYPQGPLGDRLFRIRPGAFHPSDLADGTFRSFADARHLILFNTVRISRNLAPARPGDLLFFYQPGHNEPYHTMLYVGGSTYFPTHHHRFVVYDTGVMPDGRSEIRMMALKALRHYPIPRWRPALSNPRFLGVYRWKILE